jgi:hypothetical protein
VGFDLGNGDAAAAWRVNGDANAVAWSGQVWEFDTMDEALAFRGRLAEAAARSAAVGSVSLPAGGDVLGRVIDWALPDPLAGDQPRYTYSEIGVSAKAKADLSAYLSGGGADAGVTTLLGDRVDNRNGSRTVYIRSSGDAWGGLAMFGLGPNLAGIGRGDGIVALTVDAGGEPLDLSVTFVAAGGAHGGILQAEPGGELRGGLRDRADKIPNFHNFIGTLTRTDGERQELVARISLQDPDNRAAAMGLLAAFGYDASMVLSPERVADRLTGATASPLPGPLDLVLERIRRSGRVTLTTYGWNSAIFNPEIGIGAGVRFGLEGNYGYEHYRNEGTRVLYWGQDAGQPLASPPAPVAAAPPAGAEPPAGPVAAAPREPGAARPPATPPAAAPPAGTEPLAAAPAWPPGSGPARAALAQVGQPAPGAGGPSQVPPQPEGSERAPATGTGIAPVPVAEVPSTRLGDAAGHQLPSRPEGAGGAPPWPAPAATAPAPAGLPAPTRWPAPRAKAPAPAATAPPPAARRPAVAAPATASPGRDAGPGAGSLPFTGAGDEQAAPLALGLGLAAGGAALVAAGRRGDRERREGRR